VHGQFSRHLCLHICTASAYDAGAGSGGRETEAGAGRSHPELRGAVAEPSVPVRDKTRPVRGTQGRTKEHRQIRGSCLASAAALQRGHPAAGARHWRTVALTRRSRHRTVEEKKSAPGFTTDVSFPTHGAGAGRVLSSRTIHRGLRGQSLLGARVRAYWILACECVYDAPAR